MRYMMGQAIDNRENPFQQCLFEIFKAGVKMIDKRLQAYRTYQRFLRILLSICGCWYMPTKFGKFTYCWSVCAIVMISINGMIVMHLSYLFRHKLAYMMKSIGLLITAISNLLKVGTFLINRGSLINHHRTLNDLFEEELMQNKKVRAVIFSPLRSIYILGYTYFAVLIAMLLAFYAPAYILIIRHLLHFQLPPTNYSLPASNGLGYFWTVPDNFLYHLHMLFETAMMIIICMTASSVDCVFGLYVYQYGSTMRAMTFRLTNSLPAEKFTNLLKTCVAKHQKLLRCRDTLQHIYGPIVFWHIVTNAILLCTLIYNLVQLSKFTFVNASMSLTYALIKLLQTFMYAWHGTFLTTASEDFRKGLYFSEWPNSDLNVHVRTNVILVMMQKPMTIKAVFSSVDIVIFTNFVNTTMSYFFLLQSVADKGG